jgi:hypothetical protein
LIERVLHGPKQDPRRTSARRRPADLDAAAIRVHMELIDTWPNDLGRFASLLTGAHVSDPFSKIDQPTNGADSSAPKSYVYVVSDKDIIP